MRKVALVISEKLQLVNKVYMIEHDITCQFEGFVMRSHLTRNVVVGDRGDLQWCDPLG